MKQSKICVFRLSIITMQWHAQHGGLGAQGLRRRGYHEVQCIFGLLSRRQQKACKNLAKTLGKQTVGCTVHPTVCFSGAHSGPGGPRTRPRPRRCALGSPPGNHRKTIGKPMVFRRFPGGLPRTRSRGKGALWTHAGKPLIMQNI